MEFEVVLLLIIVQTILLEPSVVSIKIFDLEFSLL